MSHVYRCINCQTIYHQAKEIVVICGMCGSDTIPVSEGHTILDRLCDRPDHLVYVTCITGEADCQSVCCSGNIQTDDPEG